MMKFFLAGMRQTYELRHLALAGWKQIEDVMADPDVSIIILMGAQQPAEHAQQFSVRMCFC